MESDELSDGERLLRLLGDASHAAAALRFSFVQYLIDIAMHELTDQISRANKEPKSK